MLTLYYIGLQLRGVVLPKLTRRGSVEGLLAPERASRFVLADPHSAEGWAMTVIWFVYVGFVNARLGPVLLPKTVISNASFAKRIGNLYARHTPTDQINGRLLQSFNDHYRRHHHLPVNGESVLSYLQQDYQYEDEDVDEFR